MDSFRLWLEAVEGYRNQIQAAAIEFYKQATGDDQDAGDDEILDKSIKQWSPDNLKAIWDAADRKNLGEKRRDDLVARVTSKDDKVPSFKIKDLIDQLDSESDVAINMDKQSTYAPKKGNLPGQAQSGGPTNQMNAAPPQQGPAPSAPGSGALSPPQL